jgi:hypothetical protein
LIYKKTNNETHESRKQLTEEIKEFRKITESLIKGAEKLRLLDNEKVKNLKKELSISSNL